MFLKRNSVNSTHASDLIGRVSKCRYQQLLQEAGITIDGNEPWDIQIHDGRLWKKIGLYGTLGFGEAYTDGWWDAPSVDQLVYRLAKLRAEQKVLNIPKLLWGLTAKFRNLQSISRSKLVGMQHYDLDNDLYRDMLGERMVYTCAYWEDSIDLDMAQEKKLELVCDKLGIEEGMHVLDIGCGWGSFAQYVAQVRKAKVTGVTISREQGHIARERCARFPVDIRIQDYRALENDEKFDRIVSLGMFEHVGRKNYKYYMRYIRQHLNTDGLALIQTVGLSYKTNGIDPWVAKYIFPNSEVPTIARISTAIEGTLKLEDWHNFGADYDKTLLACQANFVGCWEKYASKHDRRFYRLWNYYLLMFAGLFRARNLDLWQLVLSPNGVDGGYSRPSS
jgi:cyclopropane-fatty-acyl-phospholipid synthase